MRRTRRAATGLRRWCSIRRASPPRSIRSPMPASSAWRASAGICSSAKRQRLASARCELLPALELLHQQPLDFFVPALVFAQGLGRLAVVVGAGHFFGERFLLGFE